MAGCILTLSIALSACSRPTAVSPTWQEQPSSDALKAAPFDRVIVIGISQNSNQRRRFENEMTARLKNSGTTAWPSYTSLEPGAAINRENVLKATEKLSANAVLVTRLANNKVSTKDVDERTEVESTPESQTPIGIFRRDYKEYEEPGYVVVKYNVSLISEFYAVKGAQLLYSIETTTYDKETEFDVLDDVTKAISKQLRKDGLIQ